MSQVEVPAPHGWGKDLLTSWFDDFRGNQHATFSNKPKVVADLIGIDTLFDRFLNGAIDPEPFYPMDFFLRAHSAYRSATSAVMAGQIYEAQVLLRLCLDLGAYGIYVGADKRRWVRWLARSDSSDAKKVVRAEFTHNKIKIHIKNLAPKTVTGLKHFTIH